MVPTVYNIRDNYLYFLNEKVKVLYEKINNKSYTHFVGESIENGYLIKIDTAI